MNLQEAFIVWITHLLLILCVIQISDSQLRITNGQDLGEDGYKNYMVYLIKAAESERFYDHWICGGAIVTESFILTSAACVEDVKHMYAVAGMRQYVPKEYIDENKCVQSTKKKIVEYCVPHAYTFDFKSAENWSRIDIALAKVEVPYQLDKPWPQDCELRLHTPVIIPINFYSKYQEPGTDTFVLGWGHNESMRMEADMSDQNQNDIKYTSTKIIEKDDCKQSYQKSTYNDTLDPIIDNYMICTDGEGQFDADGILINFDFTEVDGCTSVDTRLRSQCIEKLQARMGMQQASVDNTRKDNTRKDNTRQDNTRQDNTRKDNARKNGICQNDHGGPLITWVGSHEYVIGVASVFLIKGPDLKCTGPYLFASTFCNSGFLRCVLRSEPEYADIILDDDEPKPTTTTTTTTTEAATTEADRLRQKQESGNLMPKNKQQKHRTSKKTHHMPTPPPPPEYGMSSEDDNDILSYLNFLRGGPELDVYCNQPARKRGFEIVNTKISWRDHPDGPTEAEKAEDLAEKQNSMPISYKKIVLE